MIANMILSLNIVLPLFFEMFLGGALRKLNLLNEQTDTKLNRLVFRCFLPVMLFYNIYSSDLKMDMTGKLLFFAVLSVLGIFAAAMLIVPCFEKSRKKAGVLIQVSFRSNFVLLGIPLAISLSGEEKAGITAVLVAVIIPMYNILAVITLERFRGEKLQMGSLIRGILTNPLVIASVLGLAVYGTGIVLPECVDTTLDALAKIATPLALIVLGAEFRFDAVKEYKKQLTAGLLLRLVIVPAVFLLLAVQMGFRGDHLVPLLVMFASPAAVSSYTMAEMMDADGVLAGQLVFYSTAFSIVTLFLFIFVFKSLGLI